MLSQLLFIHHVYFWLKNPNNQEDYDALLKGLQSLRAVTSINSFHIGIPAETNREVIDTSYAFSWLAIFNSKEEQDAYQEDPIHLKFVKEYGHLWEKVVVYDSIGAFDTATVHVGLGSDK